MFHIKNTKAMNSIKETALWAMYILVMATAIIGAMLFS
jgi:hypothetical protein